MKKFLGIFCAVLALLSAILFSAPRTSAQQAQLVSAVLSRMESNYTTLKTLRSNITMVKYNSQTRESDQYEGYLHYLPGKGRSGNVRLDWQRPAQEVIAVKDGKYTYYRARINTAYTGKTAVAAKKDGGALNFLSMSGAQLRSAYNAQVVGNETIWGNIATTKLYLTPKAKSGYKYAEVWVDGNGMPVQIKVTQNNDDSTAIRVYNVDRNSNFGDVFALQLPANVKIVKG